MTSNSLMIDGVSATALHEAAHAVVHLTEHGTFRYVTLRPRSKDKDAHIVGFGAWVSPATLIAGAVAEAMYTGAAKGIPEDGLFGYLAQHGGGTDVPAFLNLVEVIDPGSVERWFDKSLDLVEKHWEEIILVATMLERMRTLTVRQVRMILDHARAEAA